MKKIIMNMRNKWNNIYKHISKNSTYTDMTLEKEEIKFSLSSFYKKHRAYLPNNISPSSNFLSWFVGFTEGEGWFIFCCCAKYKWYKGFVLYTGNFRFW